MIITNIQRMCIDDGPGMRTTVFLKGCPLHCVWCHNPECILADGEPGFWENWKKSFVFDGDTDALCKRLAKDKRFFRATGGGVTISGGEPLLYSGFVREMGEKLKQQGISMAVDTCGYVPWEHFEEILEVTEVFLYDLKGWNPQLHKKLTGQDNGRIWENFYHLLELEKKLWVRIPVVKGGNSEDLLNIVRQIPPAAGIGQVNLLPYHEMGIGKYQKLGKEYQKEQFQKPDMELLKEAEGILREKNIVGLIRGE